MRALSVRVCARRCQGAHAVQDPIAVTYHNTSPLENVHAAVLVRLMLQPSLNFLSHLAPDVLKNVRKYAVSAILHTDPVSHRSHMDAWAGHVPKWQRTVASVQSTVPVGTDLSTDEIHSVLGMVLKCADVGHMAQPFEQHRHWVAQLTEEFYQQGDREKALGMAPLPFMDRAKAQCVPSSQVRACTAYAVSQPRRERRALGMWPPFHENAKRGADQHAGGVHVVLRAAHVRRDGGDVSRDEGNDHRGPLQL